MKNINYSGLEKVSGLSLMQLKRAAIALYGPGDTAGGRGMVREFSLEQGFQICLFGLLVNGYQFKIAGALVHAERIFAAMTPLMGNDLLIPPDQPLLRTGFLPSLWWGKEKEVPDADLEILTDRYIIRTFKERPTMQGGEIVARYTERHIPVNLAEGVEELDPVKEMAGPAYRIPIGAILKQYIKNVRALG